MDTNSGNLLLGLVQQTEYRSLEFVITSIYKWEDDPRRRAESLRVNCRNGLIDLVDFLGRLPELLGYGSEVEMALGFELAASNGAVALTSPNELDALFALRTQAFILADLPDDPDPDSIRERVSRLIDEVAAFSARRKRLADVRGEAAGKRRNRT